VFRPDTAVTREDIAPHESHDTPRRRADGVHPDRRRDRADRPIAALETPATDDERARLDLPPDERASAPDTSSHGVDDIGVRR
jgi:hypothetical protein